MKTRKAHREVTCLATYLFDVIRQPLPEKMQFNMLPRGGVFLCEAERLVNISKPSCMGL